jgi:penicillin V acylase-like amidase (Ntn superfamily)
MKFLNELLNEQEYDDTFPGDDTENPEDELSLGNDKENSEDVSGLDSDDKSDIKDVVNKATENPDKQGAIRVVPGAHLVYKRQSKDGTYEELWMYKNEDVKKALGTRRDIISGTDIPVNKSTSDDASQSYTIWTTGNVEILHITGLQN